MNARLWNSAVPEVMCGDVALTGLFIQQKQVDDSMSLNKFSRNFVFFFQNY